METKYFLAAFTHKESTVYKLFSGANLDEATVKVENFVREKQKQKEPTVGFLWDEATYTIEERPQPQE